MLPEWIVYGTYLVSVWLISLLTFYIVARLVCRAYFKSLQEFMKGMHNGR